MATETALSVLTLLLIKPMLIVLVIVGGAWLLRKKSAALQHFWLAIGLSALVLLPVSFSVLPQIKWQVLPLGQQASLFFSWVPPVITWLGDKDNTFVVAAIYFTGAFSLLFYLLLGILAIAVQTRQAKICKDYDLQFILDKLNEEMGISARVSMVTSRSVSSPQMWGIFRPVIMLPDGAPDWSRERKFSVLLHELGHVVRHDWATTLVVKICCAVFWFLPPVWWLANRLFHYAEIACDDYVYRVNQNILVRNREAVYAENLLDMACSSRDPASETTLMMAAHSSVFYRIEAVLDHQRQRSNAAPEARHYPVLTLLLLLFLFASLQLVPVQQTLVAHASRIHLSQTEEVSVAPPASTVSALRMDAETLQKLKQQTHTNKLPAVPHEWVLVTSEVLDPRDLEVEQQPAIDPVGVAVPLVAVPLIQIQGYMPSRMAMPVYPRHALERGTEGEVVVEFSIEEDGSISAPRILWSHPRHVFDKAVLSALENSRYQPQIIDGVAVVIEGVTETFKFQIEQSAAVDKRRR